VQLIGYVIPIMSNDDDMVTASSQQLAEIDYGANYSAFGER
jgi:hypothetical protein